MTPDRLSLSIQKSGRLADQSRDLLAKAGIRIQPHKGQLTARASNFPLDLMLVRDDDIPTFVADGVTELGIVGENVLGEYALSRPGVGIEVLNRLGFGRCALRFAVPRNEEFSLDRLAGARIATSYPLLTRAYLEERGIEADIVTMRGAVELAPRLGIASVICDLVSTGQTLEANGLRPTETVLESEAVLVRTGKVIDHEHAALLDQLKTRIDGVIQTRESKYIVLNAPESALSDISRILPGADAPTVVPLVGSQGHVAVQAVCQESVFWETLEALKHAGARDILVMPIEKMML